MDEVTDDVMDDVMDETASSRHRRAWDLIPWVVNGSASAADRQLVEAHVAACEDCRNELAFQQQVHAGMGADEAPVPDAQAALQRFWDEAPRRAEALVDAGHAAPSAPPGARRAQGSAVRWLAAAVVVQAIGLAVLGGMLWERPRAADYETLSRSAPAAVPATIRLVPAPGLPVGELRSLLARCGVQLVDISADGGIFGAVLRADAGIGIDQALARLRAEPGVLLAEPIVAAR